MEEKGAHATLELDRSGEGGKRKCLNSICMVLSLRSEQIGQKCKDFLNVGGGDA